MIQLIKKGRKRFSYERKKYEKKEKRTSNRKIRFQGNNNTNYGKKVKVESKIVKNN